MRISLARYVVSFLLLFCAFITNAYAQTATYTVGGTISGLAAGKTVVLKNNSNTLLVSSNTGFTFPAQASGTNWNVFIAIQPSGQTCSVTNGSGTNISANVTTVSVTCANTYTVGGTVSGLAGASLVLRMGTISLVVSSGATAFKFGSGLKTGAAYAVLVGIQPSGYQCSAANNIGTIGTANITNVSITCAKTYTVSGLINGLSRTGLSIKLNSLTKSISSGDSAFSFASGLLSGAQYSVTILTQPIGQNCYVNNGFGVITNIKITNVVINCYQSYSVGGSVSGLDVGKQLKLSISPPTSSLSNTAAGITFDASSLGSESTVVSSTVGWGFALQGRKTLTHLGAWTGGGSFGDIVIGVWNQTGNLLATASVLQNNIDSYESEGGFSYAALSQSIILSAGESYTVGAFYSGGLLASFGAPVTPINGLSFATQSLVDFSGASSLAIPTTSLAPDYTNGFFGPNLRFLGAGNAISNAEEVTLFADGSFQFPTKVDDGSSYQVIVTQQPLGQLCSVVNSTGLVISDVSNIIVNCVANTFTILVNNPDAASILLTGGTFTNATNPSNSTSSAFTVNTGDSVTLSASKSGYSCTVSPSGVINSIVANVTRSVSCAVNAYTLSVSNPDGASVVINGTTQTNLASAAANITFNTTYGNTGVSVTASKLGSTCTVGGTVIPSPITGSVTGVTVACTQNSYQISGNNPSGANISISGSSVTGQSPTSATAYSYYAKYGDVVSLTATKTGYTCTVAGSPLTMGAVNVTSAHVTCIENGYVLGVFNPDGATVSIIGTTQSNAASTASNITFNTTYGNTGVTVSASKSGYTCLVGGTTIPSPIVGNVSGVSVSCNKNTYSLLISNPSSALVSISGTTQANAASTATSITFNTTYGNTGVTVVASKAGYTCTVGGTTIPSPITDNVVGVSVNCVINTYTLGVTNPDGAAVSISGTTQTNAVSTASSITFNTTYGNTGVAVSASKAGYTCTVGGTSVPSTITDNVSGVTVSCSINTYTLSVSNPDGATVSISGTTQTNASSTASSIVFNTTHGNTGVAVSATKAGYTCLVGGTAIPSPITATITGVTVSCSINTYTLSVSNPDGATVSISGTTQTNASSTASSIVFNTTHGNTGVVVSATKIGAACVVAGTTIPSTITGNITGVTVSCPVTTYTLSVSNPSGASVSITGTTQINGSSSATNITFNATYGNTGITITAVKTGYLCSIGGTVIPSPITANVTGITVNCTINTYTLSVSNPGGAIVSITGTTQANDPSSATGISFNTTYGNTGVALSAAKTGYNCVVGGATIPSIITGNLTGFTVSCTLNTYTLGVSNPDGANVTITGTTQTNAPSTAITIAFNTTYGNAGVIVSATKTGYICTVGGTAIPSLITGNVTGVAISCTLRTFILSVSNPDGATVSVTGTTQSNSPSTASSIEFNTTYSNTGVAVTASKIGYLCLVAGNTIPSPIVGNVTGVTVVCSANAYTLAVSNPSAATVSITGTTQANAASNATSITFNTTYGNTGVAVSAVKTGYTCTTSGTVIPSPITANVTGVIISCLANTYTIGGSNDPLATISIAGSSVLSQSPTAANPYSFNAKFGDVVTLTATKPGYTCSVAGSPITVSAISISSANVTCTINSYTVGGTVSGNTEAVLVTNNGADDQLVASGGGSFTFTPQTYGASYDVNTTSPTGQTCLVINGYGASLTASVTNVSVLCTTNTYVVSGSISGYITYGTRLALTLTDTTTSTVIQTISSITTGSTSFNFTSGVPYTHNWTVTVSTQSAGQYCSVTNGSGTNMLTAVTTVAVSCILPPAAPVATVTFNHEPLRVTVNWPAVTGASYYTINRSRNGSVYTPICQTNSPSSTSCVDTFSTVAEWVTSNYKVSACNSAGCNDAVPVAGFATSNIQYIKASNTDASDSFGQSSIALSADGTTMAIGVPSEDSNATGVNGVQTNNTATNSGAVYVFVRVGDTWSQQAYVKASNTEANDQFGRSIALSQDGSTLAVGAPYEDSGATGIDGNQNDNLGADTGAIYVFTRSGASWTQRAYIKAAFSGYYLNFGYDIDLSSDGNTLAGGTYYSGVFIFTRNGSTWSQESVLTSSNFSNTDQFGSTLDLSADGNTLAVGAPYEDSVATGVNGYQADNNSPDSGAVYIFTRSSTTWTQQAYIKSTENDLYNPDAAGGGSYYSSPNTGYNTCMSSLNRGSYSANSYCNYSNLYVTNDHFGASISLSSDGNTLAVGAPQADNTTGYTGDQAGKVFIYTRSGTSWSPEYQPAGSNVSSDDQFGTSVGLSADGNVLAIGAPGEDGSSTGVYGNQADNGATDAGAVYLFTRSGTSWGQKAYVKPSNTGAGDAFGTNLAVSADGATLVVNAPNEDSNAIGINGNQTDNTVSNSGALYIY